MTDTREEYRKECNRFGRELSDAVDRAIIEALAEERAMAKGTKKGGKGKGGRC